jgi:hypothetical protein
MIFGCMTAVPAGSRRPITVLSMSSWVYRSGAPSGVVRFAGANAATVADSTLCRFLTVAMSTGGANTPFAQLNTTASGSLLAAR